MTHERWLRTEHSDMGESHVAPALEQARVFQGRRAGVITRVVAAVINAAVILGVMASGYVVLICAVFLWNPAGFSVPSQPFLVVLVIAGVLTTAYLTVCWHVTGRTYGDLVMAIRIVDRNGHRPALQLAVVRAAFCVLVPIGLFLALVNRQNRSLQDVVLRTTAIYDWALT